MKVYNLLIASIWIFFLQSCTSKTIELSKNVDRFRQLHNLKGAIKSIDETKTSSNSSGQTILNSYNFLPNGLLESITSVEGNQKAWYRCEYNKDGFILKEELVKPQVRAPFDYVFVYELDFDRSYTYNAKNELIESFEKKQGIKSIYTYFKDQNFYQIKNYLNDEENLETTIEYDKNQDISYISYHGSQGTIDHRYKYNDGKLISDEFNTPDGSFQYSYNPEGNISQIVEFGWEGYSDPPECLSKFEYEYDDQGNWTKRIEYRKELNKPKETIVSIRTIKY